MIGKFERLTKAFNIEQSDCLWALIAGACGHTYGHNCVWQMWTPEHEPTLFGQTSLGTSDWTPRCVSDELCAALVRSVSVS